ncbi:MAG TPA: hypothetical protein VFU31_20800 [Candidatus Binatia bacterium]|nr:hypothetical protein [Candidatus Binatia bacterium]
MQDLAGCRVEVDNLMEQDRVVDELKRIFPNFKEDDRRERPSHGYRAVHLIVEVEEHPVEIQVRTHLQHSWASASEKLSDMVDPEIKYGGGPEEMKRYLADVSDLFADFEMQEVKWFQTRVLVQEMAMQSVNLDELVAKLVEKDEKYKDQKYKQMLERIKTEGFMGSVHKLDLELNALRETMNAKLQEFCESLTIGSEDTSR